MNLLIFRNSRLFKNLLLLCIRKILKIGLKLCVHKPLHLCIVISNDSNHPLDHKLAAFNSMIHRLLIVTMSKVNYDKKLNIIKQIAFNNGYSIQLIDQMIRKKQFKITIHNVYPTPKNIKNHRCISYFSNISYKITPYLRKLNLDIILEPTTH